MRFDELRQDLRYGLRALWNAPAFAPARSRIARRELPGPKLRDPLNQADGHRLGQWELERPLAAFVWRQLLGERLDQRIACGIERVV